MRLGRRFELLLVLATAMLLSGCALRNLKGAHGETTDDSLATHMQKVRHLSQRPLVKATSLRRVEEQDPELTAALKLLAIMPTGERHRNAAERYRLLGVADLAYTHFSRAVALDSRDAAAHDGLARVWRDWGFPELALGDAHRAVHFAPASAAAHNTMGTILQALGQRDAARRSYEQAARLEPHAVYALSNLCYLSFLDGDFERAMTRCRSALEIDPGFIAARNNLALAHAAAGRPDLAASEFLDAGDDAIAFFNIGIVHLAAREYAQAAKAFDAASRANPLMAVARERAAQARRLVRAATREVTGDPR